MSPPSPSSPLPLSHSSLTPSLILSHIPSLTPSPFPSPFPSLSPSLPPSLPPFLSLSHTHTSSLLAPPHLVAGATVILYYNCDLQYNIIIVKFMIIIIIIIIIIIYYNYASLSRAPPSATSGRRYPSESHPSHVRVMSESCPSQT